MNTYLFQKILLSSLKISTQLYCLFLTQAWKNMILKKHARPQSFSIKYIKKQKKKKRNFKLL